MRGAFRPLLTAAMLAPTVEFCYRLFMENEKSAMIRLAEEFVKLEKNGCDPRIVEALRTMHGGLFCMSVVSWHEKQSGTFQDGILHVIDSAARNRMVFEEKVIAILQSGTR